MAQGGEAQLDGVVAGVGEVGSSGGVVDRGGRAVVEDEDDVAGHQSLRRGRHRLPGGFWDLWVEGIEGGGGLARNLTGARAAEVGSSPVIGGFPGGNTRGGEG